MSLNDTAAALPAEDPEVAHPQDTDEIKVEVASTGQGQGQGPGGASTGQGQGQGQANDDTAGLLGLSVMGAQPEFKVP